MQHSIYNYGKLTGKEYIDLSYLEDISMGDESMIAEMIEMFLEMVPQSLSELRSLRKKNEWGKLQAEAHKLKPNFAYMGIETGKKLLQEIEDCARGKKQPEEVDEKLDKLEKIYQAASGHLQRKLEEINRS